MLRRDEALRLIGTCDGGHDTIFDTSLKGGGLGSAPSPMSIVMQAAAACTSMDVLPILEKRRKTIDDWSVELDGVRADEHPKVFTSIQMRFYLKSPDVTEKELRDAIELSENKYCSVSIMLTRSGCKITWSAVLENSLTGERTEFQQE
jgi:putative redox protein